MTSTHLIGVDVGGTKIAAATVTSTGTLERCVTSSTPASGGPSAVLDAIAAAVESLPGWDNALGVGVGTGGVIDHQAGKVLSANNLLPGWAGTNISGELGARLRLPIAVDNDVNAFALGEHRFGAGRDHSSVLYASVGTGIGGAIVIDGHLHRGAHCTAGEFGHIAVPEAVGRECNCGRSAHLEAIASGPAISAYYRELSGGLDSAEVPVLAELAERGDAVATHAISHGATALGRALGGLVNTIDVEHVVVGGGVTAVGELYWQSLSAAFSAELLPAPSVVTIEPAALGARSAVIGAAMLALDHTQDPDQWGERPGKAKIVKWPAYAYNTPQQTTPRRPTCCRQYAGN